MKIKNHGFAMIEVLVTAIIVAIGISGMGVLLLQSIQGTQDSAQRSQAMWIVEDYVGRIRANSVGARAGHYELATTPDCDTPPAKICVDHRIGGDFTVATPCDDLLPNNNEGAEMAAFDRWVSVCSLNPGINDGASDFMVDPKLSSTCIQTSARISTPTGNPDCVRYRVQLSWQAKNQNVQADGTKSYENEYSMIVEVN